MAGTATNVQENTVSNWAAPVIGGLVNSAVNTASQGYQPYGGEQVAGASNLQNSAFSGIAGLAQPNAGVTQASGDLQNTFNKYAAGSDYKPTTFDTGLGPVGTVQSYMNPYLQQVVDVQSAEAKRQAAIQNAANAKQFVQSGAFGGDRSALMQAELQRNLGTQLGSIEATGLNTAYDKAQAQRLAEAQLGLKGQEDTSQANQFGANLGLQYLQGGTQAASNLGNLGLNQEQYGLAQNKQMADLGATQRGITQEGLTADYNNFLQQRDWDKTQQKYLKDIMSGLPIGTQNTYGQLPNATAQGLGGALTAAQVLQLLFGKSSGTSAASTTGGTTGSYVGA